jgi:hypothetical protein
MPHSGSDRAGMIWDAKLSAPLNAAQGQRTAPLFALSSTCSCGQLAGGVQAGLGLQIRPLAGRATITAQTLCRTQKLCYTLDSSGVRL